MTDNCPSNVSAPADDAAAVARLNKALGDAFGSGDLAAMSIEDLRNLAGMRISFCDDAPPELRRTFHARQRLAQEMLDEN